MRNTFNEVVGRLTLLGLVAADCLIMAVTPQ